MLAPHTDAQNPHAQHLQSFNLVHQNSILGSPAAAMHKQKG
jgi:hypothetical protein